MKLHHLLLGLSATLLLACNNDDQGSPPAVLPEAEQVTISYTAHGVPHIQARSYRALGYGVGYAQASENLCTLAEQLIKLKGEKSRYFGAGADQKICCLILHTALWIIRLRQGSCITAYRRTPGS